MEADADVRIEQKDAVTTRSLEEIHACGSYRTFSAFVRNWATIPHQLQVTDERLKDPSRS
jgi:hypothetical protein